MHSRGDALSSAASPALGVGAARDERMSSMTAALPKAVFQVTVQDRMRAQEFYRDGLGATIRASARDEDGITFLGFESGIVVLEPGGDGSTIDTGLAIEVEDLTQTCDAVERAGGRVFRPADKEWLAIVTDTEGNRICVVRPGGCYFHPSAVPEP